MAMTRNTIAQIEEARTRGIGVGRWADPISAPVSWSTMRKYPDVFELHHEYEECEDEYGDQWTREYRWWRFR